MCLSSSTKHSCEWPCFKSRHVLRSKRLTSRFAKRELHWLDNKLHKHGDVFHISTMGTVDASEVLDQCIYFFLWVFSSISTKCRSSFHQTGETTNISSFNKSSIRWWGKVWRGLTQKDEFRTRNLQSYCWWKKSGDHQLGLVVCPTIYRVFYIPHGAGFLPSTVVDREKTKTIFDKNPFWGAATFPIERSCLIFWVTSINIPYIRSIWATYETSEI